jgi:hypothetical protein
MMKYKLIIDHIFKERIVRMGFPSVNSWNIKSFIDASKNLFFIVETPILACIEREMLKYCVSPK